MIKAKEYLLQIPMWAKKKNTLSNLKNWMSRLGVAEDSLKVIHVAGTNGKGSVCAFLTNVLIESGYQTGTFVSPHLIHLEERFLINGKPVSQDLFQQSFEVVYNLSTELHSEGDWHLTFFEYVFLMAMWMFQQQQLDVIILETGLGGRLDATNIISHPWMTIITSVSLDHTQYLGETLDQIAAEKAGIIKFKTPLVFDGSDPLVSEIMINQAKQLQSPYDQMMPADVRVLAETDLGGAVAFRMQDGSEAEILLATVADYQRNNAMLAIRALERLNDCLVTRQAIVSGISNTYWPGRMQEIKPGIFLDGAHNPGGIEALIATISKLGRRTGKALVLLFAVMNDKDYSVMIEMIAASLVLKHITVVQVHDERGLSQTDLVSLFKTLTEHEVSGFDTVEQALQDAILHKEPEDLLFCTGSLYLIGRIQELIQKGY